MPTQSPVRPSNTKLLLDPAVINAGHPPGTTLTDTKAIGLRVTFYESVATFTWNGRVKGGGYRRVTLGHVGEVTLRQARELAAECRKKAREGANPAPYIAPERRKAKGVEATFGTYIDAYIERVRQNKHATRTRRGTPGKMHIKHQEKKLQQIRDLIGDPPLSQIGREHALMVAESFSEQSNATRYSRFQAVERYMKDLLFQGIIERNPFDPVFRPVNGESRQRALAPPEIRAFWRACETLAPDWCDYYRLMLCVPLRRKNCVSLKREQIDVRAKLISLPKTKSGDAWRVPYAGLGAEIIERRCDGLAGDDFIFPARGPNARGKVHMDNFVAEKERLDAAMLAELPKESISSLEPWTLHDLRRTVTTNVCELDHSVVNPVADLWLQHRPSGVAGTYNRGSFIPQTREVAAKWDAVLREILAPTDPDGGKKVTHLRAVG